MMRAFDEGGMSVPFARQFRAHLAEALRLEKPLSRKAWQLRVKIREIDAWLDEHEERRVS